MPVRRDAGEVRGVSAEVIEGAGSSPYQRVSVLSLIFNEATFLMRSDETIFALASLTIRAVVCNKTARSKLRRAPWQMLWVLGL